MNTDEIKYFLYARKSTESEDRQMASIPDQIDEMQRIAEKLGLNVVEIISESRSAKQPGREAFNAMLNRIYKGEANGILCWKLNRLARNPIDGGQISWMLQQGTIQHIQTNSQGFRPIDPVLMMQLEFGMANQYVKDLSVDVKRGLRKKAERGWYPSARLPPGYRHNKTVDGVTVIGDEIAIDEELFPLVKSLWNKMLSGGYSIASIKREGDKLGLRTKKGYFPSYNGYVWIFTNRFYCGYFHWNDESGNQILLRGKHTPMITEQQFNQVQYFLGKHGKPTRQASYDFPFRGPIQCGECGCAVTAERKLRATCTNCKKRFSMRQRTTCPNCGLDVSDMKKPVVLDKTYYRCTKKKGYCTQRAIESDELEKQIKDKIREIAITKKFHSWATEAIQYIKQNDFSESLAIQSHLIKRETELLKRINNIARMRADNEITIDRMRQLEADAHYELAVVRSEMKEIRQRATDWDKIMEAHLLFAQTALEEFETNDDKKMSILKGLGSNHLLKGKKLYISMLEPLIGLKKTYSAIERFESWFEPLKVIGNKGKSKEIMVPITVGRARLKQVRAMIIEKIKTE